MTIDPTPLKQFIVTVKTTCILHQVVILDATSEWGAEQEAQDLAVRRRGVAFTTSDGIIEYTDVVTMKAHSLKA